jgi:hypothetical protein
MVGWVALRVVVVVSSTVQNWIVPASLVCRGFLERVGHVILVNIASLSIGYTYTSIEINTLLGGNTVPIAVLSLSTRVLRFNSRESDVPERNTLYDHMYSVARHVATLL